MTISSRYVAVALAGVALISGASSQPAVSAADARSVCSATEDYASAAHARVMAIEQDLLGSLVGKTAPAPPGRGLGVTTITLAERDIRAWLARPLAELENLGRLPAQDAARLDMDQRSATAVAAGCFDTRSKALNQLWTAETTAVVRRVSAMRSAIARDAESEARQYGTIDALPFGAERDRRAAAMEQAIRARFDEAARQYRGYFDTMKTTRARLAREVRAWRDEAEQVGHGQWQQFFDTQLGLFDQEAVLGDASVTFRGGLSIDWPEITYPDFQDGRPEYWTMRRVFDPPTSELFRGDGVFPDGPLDVVFVSLERGAYLALTDVAPGEAFYVELRYRNPQPREEKEVMLRWPGGEAQVTAAPTDRPVVFRTGVLMIDDPS